MLRNTAISMAVALLALAVFSQPAPALTPRMQFSEVVELADVIFVGKAVSDEVYENRAGLPCTRVTFELSDVLKGADKLDDPHSIILSFAGGTIGDKTMIIPEVPKVEIGQRYVLMVIHDGKDYASPVVGMHQGAYLVKTEPAGGRTLVMTLGGNFIEGFKGGNLVIGSEAQLNQKGYYESAPVTAPPAETEPPKSEDPDRVRVTAVYQVEPVVTDPANAMTLEGFIELLKEMIAAGGSE